MDKNISPAPQKRPTLKLWKDSPPPANISPHEEYENAKKTLRGLELLLKADNLPKTESVKIGLEMSKLQRRMCELKKQLGKSKPKRNPADYATHLLAAIQKVLSPPDAGRVIQEAVKNYDAARRGKAA